MKNKEIWIGGIIGLLWGFLSYPILWTNTIISYIIAFPIMIVSRIYEAFTGGDCPSPIMFFSIPLSILIGMFIGYIISKIRKKDIFSKRKSLYVFIIIGLAISSNSINLVSAADWYTGDLHQHTGFSTVGGYSGISNSGCSSEWLDPYGYTIEELKEQTIQAGYDNYWFSITDHSYCLDNSNFNDIERGGI